MLKVKFRFMMPEISTSHITQGLFMKINIGLAISITVLFSVSAQAESLRCNRDIVDIGDMKVDVIRMCGEPSFKDTVCEKNAPSN
jgi:hypothetical protein